MESDQFRTGMDAASKKLENRQLSAKALEKGIGTLEGKLANQIRYFGMSGAAVDLHRFALSGATDEQLKNARAMAATIETLKQEKAAQEQMAAAGKAAFEGTRTSAEKYNAK